MAYQKTVPTPTDASIILTYRCPMKCKIILASVGVGTVF